jgi:hypothetical protein
VRITVIMPAIIDQAGRPFNVAEADGISRRHRRLRRHGIEQLIVAGLMTEMCCDTTAREAAHRGFKVLMAADAMAAMPVKGPDGILVPHDLVHRTHLGSLNGFLATVTSAAALTATAPAR